MEEKTNVYLRILKLGIDLQGETICFNEVLEKVKNDFKVHEKMISATIRWFYDYYYLPETFRMNKGMINTLSDYELRKHDNDKAYFTGDGFFKFYEYLEVKKAFENSQIAIRNAENSTKLANKSLIWVVVSFIAAILIGLIQILILVYQQ